MSRLMRKPTICMCENKDADQLRGNAKLISAFVFATRIVRFLLYSTPKFQASSHLLCLYSPVYVGPVRKPHCWFSHEAAQMYLLAVYANSKVFVIFLIMFIIEPRYEKINNVVSEQVRHKPSCTTNQSRWLETWKFELHYPCSETKGADQLRSYCEADQRLCFRISR